MFILIFLGGFGVDFTSDTESIECGLRKVSKSLLQFGITSFCPTIVTSSKTTYHKVCDYEIFRCYHTCKARLKIVSTIWFDCLISNL